MHRNRLTRNFCTKTVTHCRQRDMRFSKSAFFANHCRKALDHGCANCGLRPAKRNCAASRVLRNIECGRERLTRCHFVSDCLKTSCLSCCPRRAVLRLHQRFSTCGSRPPRWSWGVFPGDVESRIIRSSLPSFQPLVSLLWKAAVWLKF